MLSASPAWGRARQTAVLLFLGLFTPFYSAVAQDSGIPPVSSARQAGEVDSNESQESEEDTERRFYRTREERREAGQQREITDWLTLITLMEVEAESAEFTPQNMGETYRLDDSLVNFAMESEVEFTDWARAEIVYELEQASSAPIEHGVDEAILVLEYGDFELEFGKLFVPFGEYFSHFVIGPMLEFGETRARRGVVVSYSPDDWLEVAVFGYRGRAERFGRRGKRLDWGAAVELAPADFVTFGFSYSSDLAEADDRPFEDTNDQYLQRVDAISGYGLFTFEYFEVTAEYVAAIDDYRLQDPSMDQPSAWNVELAVYPGGPFDFAFRYEGSNELEDEPARRAGASATWNATDRISLVVDLLFGRYERDFVEDDKERLLGEVAQAGVLLSMAF